MPSCLAITLALVIATLAQRDEDPRTVLAHATRAVRADSVAPLRARWAARVQRDSSDRAATFGLATIARLTYDYPTAERLYRRLLAGMGLGLRSHATEFSIVGVIGIVLQVQGQR